MTGSPPKVAWLFWDKLNLPHKIELIKAYNAPKLVGWTVHYLNPITLGDFIPADAYPKMYNTLIPAHKADWIRLYLLHKYGGCWIDMGIIINSKTKFNEIYTKSVQVQPDITVFQNSDKTFTHSSGVKIPLSIDNWFIMAPQGSIIISAWLKEFTKALDMGFLNYKRMIVAAETNVSEFYNKNDNDVYLTMHACIQNLLHNMKTIPKILYFNSKNSMYKLQKVCHWAESCLAQKLAEPAALKLPYIKLTRSNRRHQDVKKYIRAVSKKTTKN